jgi:pre-mRNA-splicing factor SYF2
LKRSSARENRASVIEESNKAKTTVRDQIRLEKQRKLAETLRLKADAEERGEDVERAKNWEWTIEDNDEWEKKQARKARRADFEFHGAPHVLLPACRSLCVDDAHAARRKYKKDVDHLKPDLEAYNRQKEIALGLAPGTLSKNGQGSSSVVPSALDGDLNSFNPTQSSDLQVRSSRSSAFLAISTHTKDPTVEGDTTTCGRVTISRRQQPPICGQQAQRGGHRPCYRQNQPRVRLLLPPVVARLNLSRSVDKKRKFSRKRANEDEGDITYINERNRVFNKKVGLHVLLSIRCCSQMLPDCALLRQVYGGDSQQFRARYSALDPVAQAV